MIQLRLILLGVTVIASVGYAIYNHYQNRERSQQYSYGPRDEDRSYTAESSDISSSNRLSNSERPRKRKKLPTASTCSICLVKFESFEANTRFLSCGHGFHNNCIEVWFNNQKTCPNCRAQV